MTTPGWEGILGVDEKIVWQGRPDGRIVWRAGNIVGFFFGLFFAGFALFWMMMASMAGGFFWMFGLIHFSVGMGISFFSMFAGAYRRRNSWYTLTNNRAFIAVSLPLIGKSLKSYPISHKSVLEFLDGDFATIFFATETHFVKNGTKTVRIGFERIDDGRVVYAKFREVQKNAT